MPTGPGRVRRRAGICDDTGTRAEDCEFRPHADATTEAGIEADLAAALSYLRERTRPDLRHSFLDPAFGEWQEACAGAWRRMPAVTDRVATRL